MLGRSDHWSAYALSRSNELDGRRLAGPAHETAQPTVIVGHAGRVAHSQLVAHPAVVVT